jgi:hypothetical protein
LPLASDKASTLASSEKLAKLAAASIGTIAGQAVTHVRKLGVDHAVSRKARACLHVHKGRMGKATIRMRKLKKARKAGGGPRVFYDGVKPAAMFGCECFAMPKGSVNKLRA